MFADVLIIFVLDGNELQYLGSKKRNCDGASYVFCLFSFCIVTSFRFSFSSSSIC